MQTSQALFFMVLNVQLRFNYKTSTEFSFKHSKITGYDHKVKLFKENCTLSYYKYPFLIFQNFPIISTPRSQKKRALTIIRGVLIIGNKEYLAAIGPLLGLSNQLICILATQEAA